MFQMAFKSCFPFLKKVFVLQSGGPPVRSVSCLLFTACCLLTGCANQGTLAGGPKDETPPRPDTLHSTRNFQTHFEKQTIVLAFDEWIELRDVFTQVVVSPPLEFRPKIERKKKTVQVLFDDREVLRDSATYLINFGQAIRDLTEGNPAPMVFVFSTGSHIDSLSVGGQVVDAFTGKPSDGVLFMLYENLADSVVRKERPFYFARTDKNGNFKVDNIRSGFFKAVALLDQNLNYRFDNEAEKIGFLDTTLLIKAGETILDTAENGDTSLRTTPALNDSIPPGIERPQTRQAGVFIRLFEEKKPLFLRSKDAQRYGMVKLAFNREPYDAAISFDSIGQEAFLETENDTIRLWYNESRDTSWNVYVHRDTSTDTVLVKSGLKDAFLQTAKLTAPSNKAVQPEKQNPGQPFTVKFNHPLASVDTSRLALLQDTSKAVVKPQLRIDSLDRRVVSATFSWQEGVLYEAVLLPGCVTDIFGTMNTDTIRRYFRPGLRKDFGTLTFNITSLRPDTVYVVRLLENNDRLVKAFFVNGATQYRTTLSLLAPGNYTLEVIEDMDRNGRWTTGRYDTHRQPERVFRKTLEQLRANWELDVEMPLDDNGPTPSNSKQ